MAHPLVKRKRSAWWASLGVGTIPLLFHGYFAIKQGTFAGQNWHADILFLSIAVAGKSIVDFAEYVVTSPARDPRVIFLVAGLVVLLALNALSYGSAAVTRTPVGVWELMVSVGVFLAIAVMSYVLAITLATVEARG